MLPNDKNIQIKKQKWFIHNISTLLFTWLGKLNHKNGTK